MNKTFTWLLGLLSLLVASGAVAQTGTQTGNSGTITSTQCVSIDTTQRSTVGIHVEGTWTGTLQPSVTVAGSSTKDNIQVTPATSSSPQSTITANGFYQVRIAGASTFYLCGNTVASGTASISLGSSSGVSVGAGGSGFSPRALLNETTDAFNRSGAMGSNWTAYLNGFTVSAGAILGTTVSKENLSAYTGVSSSATQMASATVVTLNGTTDAMGPAVRISGTPTTNVSFYTCNETSTTLTLQKITGASNSAAINRF
jgi:hypothetical protein